MNTLTDSRSARHRRNLIAALTRNPHQANLTKLLNSMLAGEFRTNEVPTIAFGLMYYQQANRDFVWNFFVENMDTFLALLPQERRSVMISLANSFCDEAKITEIKELFEPRLDKMQGGPRQLAQTIETIELCAANREAQSPSVNRFFAQRH